MSRASYAVLGGGAIGGTLAYHLARAGHPVTVIDADPEHVAAVRAHGLRLDHPSGRGEVPVRATTPADFTGRLDRVLLAVKAQATGAAADWVAPRLADDGYVVSVQNGFNEPVLAERIGWPRTIAAFVNIFADRTAPGVISDGGSGALVVGEPGGAAVSDRVRLLARDLRAWGPAQVSDNVEGFLWAKAGFGAMLAATALADDAMADLIDRHPETMCALAAEVFDVARALRVRLEPFDAFEPDAFARGAGAGTRAEALARLTSWLRTQPKNRSGIWRDLAVRRRAVEVTTHYATVLDEADRVGVAAPGLRALLGVLRELEADPDSMSERRIAELGELVRSPA
ncbi:MULTISPECIES: ketopantoate reductase family protein [unclassified Saccharopolyspora]|uniref:ketopantoate reductase family protein n=1 Tax=unclassified Saccharopolyspora TaxID=2646250 RepID=UPI001CD5D38E|nr:MULTISPECIES: 2-dehydropantoate 2-reductase [unclassified Saccharopolyspora]MCA1185036.1 2-dehydropantoate 2-reductase [Saccharopolyspora sp. 6T]MCA1226255.1 2-dehydropantoate 2-reductase [Saccharopolyspora sp. 6M]